ncbi:fatty acid--CoA ligase family protein [Kitasatospora sp. NPDC049258]|uniref:ANL family adenylate-forming protein n=1 Tax=Kitasatospora sp. NPDC049258 TaxID=3155394 RepID=UPI0034224A4C
MPAALPAPFDDVRDAAARLDGIAHRARSCPEASPPAPPVAMPRPPHALRYGYGLFPVAPWLLEETTGRALLTGLAVTAHIGAGGTPPLPCSTTTDDELVRTGGRAPEPAARAGYLTFATSGTTGAPQAVVRARPPRPYRGVAVTGRDAAGIGHGPHLMANPTFHLGTLGPALHALQAGSTVVVQQDWSAEAFAELADEHRADSTFLSPDLLLDAVEAQHAPRRPFRIVFHGGAACPPAVKRAAIDLFGPVLHEYYGTSKSVITEIGTADWLRNPGSVGRPLPGVRIEIRDRDRPVPTGQIGEICVRLRSVDQDVPGEAPLRTGDIGYVDAAGFLSVIGRADSPELVGPARLEHAIRLLPGVADVAVVSTGSATSRPPGPTRPVSTGPSPPRCGGSASRRPA